MLTDAAGKEASAMVYGALFCSVLQAAAAVAGLLLTRRRVLAYAALAAAAGVHCMYGRVLYLLTAAYPGDGLLIAALLAVLIVLLFHLICFLILNMIGNCDEIAKQA